LQSARAFIITPKVYGIIIGIIISDAYLRIPTKTHKNARLQIGQSKAHSSYLWSVFCSLSPLCASIPVAYTSVRNGVLCYGVRFDTRCLPVFTELHSMFYDSKGCKILPPLDILIKILTPVALAHIIMGDGTRQGSGLTICTDSFTVEEVVRIMTVLYVRYDIDSTINYHNGNPRIYIRASSMPTLRNLVCPYMHPSFLYKLGSNNLQCSQIIRP